MRARQLGMMTFPIYMEKIFKSCSKPPIRIINHPQNHHSWLVWVKIRYPNNWMVNTKLDISICGPTSVFHFDPHPWLVWKVIKIQGSSHHLMSHEHDPLSVRCRFQRHSDLRSANGETNYGRSEDSPIKKM